MNIAICDDDINDLETISTLVKEYSQIHKLDFSCFSSAESLYQSNESTPYDIIMLDIEMPEPNGYEIAKRLIETKQKPLIIFVTHSMAYSVRGYGVAFRYILKPVTFEAISTALDSAIIEAYAKRFVFNIEGNSHILLMDEIYYFEVYGHNVILHTADSEYTFRDTLKNIMSKLPIGYFGMPHQSYIVNFTHVKTSTSTDVHLTNGVKLPISRRKAEEFHHMFHKYLGR